MRLIGLLANGIALSAAMVPPSPGYLATVGPSPLRFEQVLAAIQTATKPLPADPTLAHTGSDLTSTNSTPAIPGGSPGATNSETNAVVLPSAPETSPAAPPAAVSTNQPAAISPQMLLQYFIDASAANAERGGNGGLHFNLAMPPAPSSSATYTSPSK